MMVAILNSAYVGFRHCLLGFRYLVIFSQIHSKTLSFHSDYDSNLFNLTQTHSFSLNLMMAGILNSAILDSAILVFLLKLTHTCQDWFPPFAQKKLHSFIVTQLDDGSHLQFCHVGFRHCHLGIRHLVIFSQIHTKTFSLHSDSDSNYFNLTQTHSFSLILVMRGILNCAILNLVILDSAILVFPLKLTHTSQDWVPTICTK